MTSGSISEGTETRSQPPLFRSANNRNYPNMAANDSLANVRQEPLDASAGPDDCDPEEELSGTRQRALPRDAHIGTMEILERRRRRLGKELHETLSPPLAGLSLLAEVIARKPMAENHPIAPQATMLKATIDHAIEENHRLVGKFNPSTFDSLTFEGAVNSLVASWRSGFSITTAAPTERTREKGLGVQMMRRRAGKIGALLTIQSNKTTGTTITCTYSIPT